MHWLLYFFERGDKIIYLNETQILELEKYCQRKFPEIIEVTDDTILKSRSAEIWAYQEAISRCKEKIYLNPEDILFDFAAYLSVSASKSIDYEIKTCFEKAYLVVLTMINFIKKF